jgi:hypothetical protein
VNAAYRNAQQETLPSVLTAHAIVEPMLTEENVPDGEANWGLGHVLTMVPSAVSK